MTKHSLRNSDTLSLSVLCQRSSLPSTFGMRVGGRFEVLERIGQHRSGPQAQEDEIPPAQRQA